MAIAKTADASMCDLCGRGIDHDRVLMAFGRVFLTDEDGRRSRLCSLRCLGSHLRDVRRRYKLANHPTPSRLW